MKVFNWIATIWNGRMRLAALMLFYVGAVFNFDVSGVTGMFLAVISIDLMYHDTYYVVGHFHLILVEIVVFGPFTANYYWCPLLTGWMYHRRLAVMHFWLTMGDTVFMFLLLLLLGMNGLPRWMPTSLTGFATLQQLATVEACIIGVSRWSDFTTGLVASVWSLSQVRYVEPQMQWGVHARMVGV